MSIEDWLRWPTKSTDPSANAAIAVLLALVVIFALVIGATVLIPVALVIGLAKGGQWYVHRPVATDRSALGPDAAAGHLREFPRCRRVHGRPPRPVARRHSRRPAGVCRLPH